MPVQHRPETSFTSTRYRLQAPDGMFLHLSGSGYVRGEDYAWTGTAAQAEALNLPTGTHELVERTDWRKPRNKLA